MKSDRTFEIRFQNGNVARASRVEQPRELDPALDELGLRQPRPTLVLVGGAGGMGDAETRLQRLFSDLLAPLVQSMDACVVDGATDSGVIRLMGRARGTTGSNFPLVGVAAAGTVLLPGAAPSERDVWQLEPHHTHFVLVPGSDWGDEVPWISRVASRLAKGVPSVTLLVNGGEVAWNDVAESVRERRPVVVLAGSGRVADVIAATRSGTSRDERAEKLIASGMIQVVELSSPEIIRATVRAGLTKE